MKINNLNRVGFWSVLFLLFAISNIYAGNICYEDSLKKSYDINDPRNPNCPCHKYQKMADDEYAKLMGKEIKKTVVRSDEFSGKSFSNEKKISKKHNSAFIKLWRKKKKIFFKQLNRGGGICSWDIWKRFSDPTACYHWK